MLMSELWDPQIADNLEAFVLFAYPWGKENTPLHNQKGPRNWQRDDLQEISEHIGRQRVTEDIGLFPEMFKKATASGRGPGKSALVSWLADWFATTRPGSSTIITANTEPQLKSKTFAEINKWTSLLVNAHWFDTSVLAVRPQDWFKEALKEQLKIDSTYYYIQGLLWSEDNPDAFAGAHNLYGMQLIFDEASGIPNKIFDVSEGFFTDPILDRYWHIFSNPRRNAGGFFDAFHKNKKFWRLRNLDTRTVEGIDLQRVKNIIEQHGIDSDMVRIEVLGQFPKQGNKQFISNQLVYDAQHRPLPEDDLGAPLIMGVDVARYGDDRSVIRFRRGRNARTIPPKEFRHKDNMALANECAHMIDTYHPDCVNIDAGNGTGVIDRLREMKYKVNEIWFGSTDGVEPEWANLRTQMYASARDWLAGGCIDDSPQLFADLTVPEYYFYGKAADKIMLQSKEELRKEGNPSPDDGDAFVLTFATRVARLDNKLARGKQKQRVVDGVDYQILPA
jgi:hypothetical protein